jgi:hypothetical protein
MLTSYPVKYVRDKYATIDIDQLSELQRLYFSYAGIFIYFRPVISGEYFGKEEMTADLMSKIVAEYRKGVALRRYLDRQDEVDSYILDFGLAISVRNFEKSDRGLPRPRPIQAVARRVPPLPG